MINDTRRFIDPDHAPVAWISLDETDKDLSWFMLYLITALQQIDAAFGPTLRPAVLSSQLPPVHELATLLINDITRIGKKFFIVLDDYHQITLPEIHQLTQFLVEHQPDSIHTVLISLEDPPFPLLRMRVRGQVSEVRERDLRFSAAEAEVFFINTMGLDLSHETYG